MAGLYQVTVQVGVNRPSTQCASNHPSNVTKNYDKNYILVIGHVLMVMSFLFTLPPNVLLPGPAPATVWAVTVLVF